MKPTFAAHRPSNLAISTGYLQIDALSIASLTGRKALFTLGYPGGTNILK